MADFKRVSVVPGTVAGLNDKNPVIAGPNNDGFNWALDYDGNIVKRPGSQTVYQLEDYIDENTSVLVATEKLLYGCATGAATIQRLLSAHSLIGLVSDEADIVSDEDIILCGGQFFWKLVPVIAVIKGVTGGAWTVSYDGTDKRFIQYLNDAQVTSTVIGWGTETTPVNYVVLSSAISGTSYSGRNQQLQPAGYLLLQKRIAQGNDIMLSAFMALRIPTSFVPSTNGAGVDGAAITGRTHRFGASGIDDTNWTAVQFNNALYFAGRKKPLLKYDGFRTYLPGAINATDPSSPRAASIGFNTVFTTGGAGAYVYRLTHKVPVVETASVYGTGIVNTVSVGFDRCPYDIPGTHAASMFGSASKWYSNIATGVNTRASMTRAGTYITTDPGAGRTFTLVRYDSPQSAHDLSIGDMVYYYDPLYDSTSPAVGIWLMILDATATTVTFDQTIATTTSTTFSLDSVEVYRAATVDAAYYLLAELPITRKDSTIMYTDPGTSIVTNPAYAELGFTPINAPAITTSVCVHQNRLLVAHDSSASDAVWEGATYLARCMDVAISEANSDQFSADTGFTLEDTKAKEIRSIVSVNDTAYLYTDRSIWYVQGSVSSADAFQVHLMTEDIGAASNNAVTVVGNNMWCLTSAGQIAKVTGGSYKISYNLKVPMDKVQNNTAELGSRLSLKHALMKYDPASRRLYIHIPYVTFKKYRTNTDYQESGLVQFATIMTQNPDLSETYVLDFNQGDDPIFYKWYGLGLAGGLVSTKAGLFGVSREQGTAAIAYTSRIFKIDDTVAHDQGTGFEMRFQSSWQELQDVQHNKRPMRLQLLSGTEGTQNFSLSVKTEQDWINNVFVDDFTASFKDGEGYAESPYATVAYGDANEPNKVFTLQGQRAKAVRLTLSNSDPLDKPLISGWSYEIADNERNTKET